MELRHLRYFVAVAEAGSLTVAAQKFLHTAQPSLSRQIRDLENHVGTRLLTRNARGIELTAAGTAFLDHARLALIQVDAASEAARRAAKPNKPVFAVGFLTGQEIDWLPEVMRVLRDELPKIDVTISSQSSSRDLGEDVMRGKLDVAFLRAEIKAPDLVYRVVTKEPLVVILPSDHRLAAREAIAPMEIAGERLLSVSAAPVLRTVIDDYLKRCGIDTKPELEADNLAMAMSLIASTRSVALLPAYVQHFLSWSVISRPLIGDVPTIDLVVGYTNANASPILKLLLSRIDDLIARVSGNRPPVKP
ncbi:MAG TPA: LysR family transcriptional regulator [Gemmatimonadales bacterium]|nr:LysR family transcriptional regulator [Gemmatimonadales bacterium]